MPEPEEMKTEDYNSDRFVRNMLSELNHYDEIFITRECNGQECGEDYWEWKIDLFVRNRKVSKKGEHLIMVLWAALQEADVAYDEIIEEQERKRKTALSKLNDEDKVILGLTR